MGHEVTGFEKGENVTTVSTPKGNFTSNFVISCTGLQRDRIAKKRGRGSRNANSWIERRLLRFVG